MNKIKLTIGEYHYKYFFDIDSDYEGIAVYTDSGNWIGQALIEMPDEDDEDSIKTFSSELEDWLIDNEL